MSAGIRIESMPLHHLMDLWYKHQIPAETIFENVLNNINHADNHYTDVEKYKKRSNDRYYAKHAEIRAERNTKEVCMCGMEYTIGNKARHFKSQFHINNI
jgi:hypothetical protein